MNIQQTLYLFWVVFIREWRVYKSRMVTFLINFLIVGPLSFALMQGYIKPLMYFGKQPGKVATVLFLGSIVMIALHRAFGMGMALFYDLQRQRVLEVQLQAVPLSIVLLGRYSFAVVMTWAFLAPAYPLSKLLLGDFFYTKEANWGAYLLVLFCAISALIAYAFLVHVWAKGIQDITKIRLRLNEFLVWFGGFNAPWYIMYQSNEWFGRIALINPMLYATEAIRQTMIPDTHFFPLFVSVPVLLCTTAFCLYMTYVTLRREVGAAELYQAS